MNIAIINCHNESSLGLKDLQVSTRQILFLYAEVFISDGKADEKTVQEQVEKIQQLRKALGEETLKNTAATDKPDVWQQVALLNLLLASLN